MRRDSSDSCPLCGHGWVRHDSYTCRKIQEEIQSAQEASILSAPERGDDEGGDRGYDARLAEGFALVNYLGD
jgi:hypothetical protein